MILDVTDVVEEYERSKRPVIATDDVGFTHDLASRDTRKLATEDDLPSYSETYFEARQHIWYDEVRQRLRERTRRPYINRSRLCERQRQSYIIRSRLRERLRWSAGRFLM